MSQATVVASAFDNGSTDDDGDTLSFSVTPAGPYDLGTTSVTLTVTDGTASDTCSAQVTLTDIEVSQMYILYISFQTLIFQVSLTFSNLNFSGSYSYL